MSFRSPLPDVVIPNLTLFDYLFADITDVADRPAVIDGPSGAQTSYGQLVRQISALAGGLAQRGFSSGDVAGILCPNVPAFVTVFHGILRAGAAVGGHRPRVAPGRAAVLVRNDGVAEGRDADSPQSGGQPRAGRADH